MTPDEPQAEIDALYRLALAEFTPARNALAKLRKARGDATGADAVKGLAKPSVSAWAVNQLWWRDRELFDELVAAGDEVLRAAQRGAGPAEQQAPMQRRRRALSALVKAAERRLDEGGHGASANTMRRITTTLEACAAFGTRMPSPGPGNLSEDLDPPGFEALSSLGFNATPGPRRTDADPDADADAAPESPPDRRRRLASERHARDVADASEKSDRLSAAVDVASHSADEARIALDGKVEIQERLERAAADARRAADAAIRAAENARRSADAADRALLDARARADEARRELLRLRTKVES